MVQTQRLLDLKIQLNENPAYEKVIARYIDKKINWQKLEHKAMLSYCKMLLEDGYIAINPVFDKLVTSRRTAIEELLHIMISLMLSG